MTKQSTIGHEYFGDIAPLFADYIDRVLQDDVWQQTGLTNREKRFAAITCATTLGQEDELKFHLAAALNTGIHCEELVALLTHLAFYAGFPAAAKAITVLRGLNAAAVAPD